MQYIWGNNIDLTISCNLSTGALVVKSVIPAGTEAVTLTSGTVLNLPTEEDPGIWWNAKQGPNDVITLDGQLVTGAGTDAIGKVTFVFEPRASNTSVVATLTGDQPDVQVTAMLESPHGFELAVTLPNDDSVSDCECVFTLKGEIFEGVTNATKVILLPRKAPKPTINKHRDIKLADTPPRPTRHGRGH